MAKKKKKSFWKKAGKAALIAGALYGAAKLGKGRKGGQEGDIGKGLGAPYIGDVGQERTNRYKFDIDHRTTPSFSAKGGRIGKKHGGHVKSMGAAKRGGGVAKK